MPFGRIQGLISPLKDWPQLFTGLPEGDPRRKSQPQSLTLVGKEGLGGKDPLVGLEPIDHLVKTLGPNVGKDNAKFLAPVAEDAGVDVLFVLHRRGHNGH